MSKLQSALVAALAAATPLAIAGTPAVPEPGTWLLVVLAAGIGYFVTKRRK